MNFLNDINNKLVNSFDISILLNNELVTLQLTEKGIEINNQGLLKSLHLKHKDILFLNTSSTTSQFIQYYNKLGDPTKIIVDDMFYSGLINLELNIESTAYIIKLHRPYSFLKSTSKKLHHYVDVSNRNGQLISNYFSGCSLFTQNPISLNNQKVEILLDVFNFYENSSTESLKDKLSAHDLKFYNQSYNRYWSNNLGASYPLKKCSTFELDIKNTPPVKSSVKLKNNNSIILKELLNSRKSSRGHCSQHLSLSDFTNIVSVVLDKHLSLESNSLVPQVKRTYSTGGALNELSVLFAFNNNSFMPKGIYSYNQETQTFVSINIDASIDLIFSEAQNNWGDENGAPQIVGIVLSNYFYRSWKYQGNVLSNSITASGCLLQNFSLIASSENIAFTILGRLSPNFINSIDLSLGILPIASFAIGKAKVV
jgi:SagB-type dehydrogenase family enzyme